MNLSVEYITALNRWSKDLSRYSLEKKLDISHLNSETKHCRKIMKSVSLHRSPCLGAASTVFLFQEWLNSATIIIFIIPSIVVSIVVC